jgi:hypothetical protein
VSLGYTDEEFGLAEIIVEAKQPQWIALGLEGADATPVEALTLTW